MNILEFETAFKYTFNRMKGMLNILWVFVPIVGWFALGGYSVRIVQEFVKGEFKQLPEMKFGEHMALGFFMFFKALPFFIVFAILAGILSSVDAVMEGIVFIAEVIAVPMLAINFITKETVESFFEFKVIKPVFDNFKEYVFAILKSLVLGFIFCLMSFFLIGIPALIFTKNIFLADFYRRRVMNR